MPSKYQTSEVIRQEIARLRRLLRERKRQALGLPSGKKRTWKRDRNGHVHEYLVGARDHLLRRMEIFRNAGGEVEWFDESDPDTIEELKPANCQGCAETHLIYWKTFHWHHDVKSHGGRRCDCANCALAVCEPWHRAFHPAGRKVEA